MIKLLKKIGTIFSIILLGDSRDLIVRTDEAIKRIDRAFKGVERDLREALGDIANIRSKVDILWEKSLAGSNSPRKLTQEGQRIFDQSRIQEIVDKNLDKLIETIEKLNPELPYDVEKHAESAMYGLKSDPSLTDFLKKGAYESGTDINTILFVGSLYLRDKYLKKHPELLNK